ncbi:MAG: DNA repair protein RecN [Candidatus Omnitrophica bacterium]|nr:DNA repair protein RecN [Candidatus Omnitrophota bacterium]MCA9425845.1 DNA repair protein RecN [Candidatus Omnitrophota bacterium]MCA9435853.1 DNA repair protein RecN [Candidatus Omnitrophota bacterium]MCA9443672.1 DNA repair protein RecN [Candidatus Omnitrophota bacterium]MCA9446051.1 DNA repair protein RecN [Candidatus Omnitrophota bacterium]
MLSELRVNHFVLIESEEIKYGEGLNVITGETGAGKSIILDALNMVLGERASSDLIRQGKDQATVEAVFDLDLGSPCYRRLEKVFDECGLELEETLILKRTLNSNGKNRCFVNNSSTTLKTLNEIGGLVVDIHGQHEHQTLLNPKMYLGILDAFGGLEKEREDIRQSYEAWLEVQKQYQDLLDQEREKNRLLDQLKFQVEEIETADLKPGEEEDLSNERRRLRNFETLNQNCQSILGALDGGDEEGGAITLLGRIQDSLETLTEADPQFVESRGLADNIVYSLEEIARTVRDYHANLEETPGRLEEIEGRLALLKDLKKKYGNTLEDVLAFLDESKQSLGRLENYEEEKAQFEGRFKELSRKLGKLATELSRKRRKVAKQLSGEITLELRQLGMEAARFEAEVSVMDLSSNPNAHRIEYPEDDQSPITSQGWDNLNFKISANAGEPLKTLKQVASGGEISRIMLAIKAILARVDQVDTMIFDEIDTGIGGKTAHVVGGKIKNLSKERQVICITHLPPIASKADHHILIEKGTDGETTSVTVKELAAEGRREELARMLGTGATEESLKLAEEMLQPVTQ